MNVPDCDDCIQDFIDYALRETYIGWPVTSIMTGNHVVNHGPRV